MTDATPQRAMILCHKSPVRHQPLAPLPSPHEPFLCAPYVADQTGRFRPAEKITQCPWAKGSERCRLKKHDFRNRKTGPCIPIRVLRCRSHGRYFTVYPMGHVPYGREPIMAVDPRGYPVDESKKQGVSRWRGSGFCSGSRSIGGASLAT